MHLKMKCHFSGTYEIEGQAGTTLDNILLKFKKAENVLV